MCKQRSKSITSIKGGKSKVYQYHKSSLSWKFHSFLFLNLPFFIYFRPLTCNAKKRESNVTTTTLLTEIPTNYCNIRDSINGVSHVNNNNLRNASLLVVSFLIFSLFLFISTFIPFCVIIIIISRDLRKILFNKDIDSKHHNEYTWIY